LRIQDLEAYLEEELRDTLGTGGGGGGGGAGGAAAVTQQQQQQPFLACKLEPQAQTPPLSLPQQPPQPSRPQPCAAGHRPTAAAAAAAAAAAGAGAGGATVKHAPPSARRRNLYVQTYRARRKERVRGSWASLLVWFVVAPFSIKQHN
jgi:hypothetical protein